MSDTDREEFRHAELDCKIIKTEMGHWCGYVRRPEAVETVRWTSDYDSKHDEILDAEVDVWGGVTYGPDEERWVGFDDGHSRNLADNMDDDPETGKEAVKLETRRFAEQIVALSEGDE